MIELLIPPERTIEAAMNKMQEIAEMVVAKASGVAERSSLARWIPYAIGQRG
jgi:hypothetical protein